MRWCSEKLFSVILKGSVFEKTSGGPCKKMRLFEVRRCHPSCPLGLAVASPSEHRPIGPFEINITVVLVVGFGGPCGGIRAPAPL